MPASAIEGLVFDEFGGVFRLTGLLPGRYYAVAVPSPPPQLDPTSLRSLATPIVVAEGANQALTLTIVK